MNTRGNLIQPEKMYPQCFLRRLRWEQPVRIVFTAEIVNGHSLNRAVAAVTARITTAMIGPFTNVLSKDARSKKTELIISGDT